MVDATITNREKAAILLIALGRDISAKIFKHLNEDEVEQLTLDITNVRRIDTETKEWVINEFYEECLAQNFFSEGGLDYAKALLEQTFGVDKAFSLINKLSATFQTRPFDFVRGADPKQLINFLQNEHPQTVALIMSYLMPSQAAGLMAGLPLDKAADVAARIATMDRTSPEYVREIERVLDKKFSSAGFDDFAEVGGIQSLVDILNASDRGTERHVLETLEYRDGELTDEIRRKMFVFEDIVKLDNRAIQRVLKDVENADLTIALKNATEEVRKMVFENMSKRLQDMIREDMEFMGPVRVRDVEEAQQKIVNVIRRLQDSGEIIVSRGSDDDVIM